MRAHCAIAFALLLVCTRGEAGVNGRNRWHKVEKIEARLHPPTRENSHAVGEYWSPDGAGTAFLVQRSADGKQGLVLTNMHVASRMPTDSQLKLDAATAKVTRWLSGSRYLDYALLHVRFGATSTAPAAVKLSRMAPTAGQALYSVGYPGISSLYLVLDGGPTSGTFTNFDRTRIDRELELEPGRVRVINAGREIGHGEIRDFVDPDPLPDGRKVVPRASFTTNLHSIPGSSGSPIFAAHDHRVVGLLWGSGESHPRSATHWGDDAWDWNEGARAIPMSRILEHIEAEHARGAYERDSAAVGELLRR